MEFDAPYLRNEFARSKAFWTGIMAGVAEAFIQMEYSTGLYYGSWNSAMAGGVLEASSVSDSIMLGLEPATSKSDDATARPLIPPWKPDDLCNAGLQPDPDREFRSLSGTIVVRN